MNTDLPNPTVTIACLSDVHGHLPDKDFIGDADAVVLAGDIVESKSVAALTEFDEYLSSLLQYYQRVFFIAGNHDFLLWENQEWEPSNPNAVYLNGGKWYKQRYSWRGLTFAGFPWTSVHNAPLLAEVWVFMAKTREHIADLLGPVPACDILVSHGPPFGILDRITNSPDNCGAHALRIRLRDWRVVVCGHIHNCFGIHDDPVGTMVINTASDYNGVLRRITFAIGPNEPPQILEVKQ